MAAIDFNTLFDRLGKIGKIAYQLAGDQSAIPALVTALIGEYDGTADDDLIGAIQTAQATIPGPVVAPATTVAGLATTTVVRMVNASVPSISSINYALTELIRQMGAATESVAQCTVTASAAALTTNVGDGVVVLTTKRGDGLIQQNLMAEVARLQVSNDSYTGSATRGQESLVDAGGIQTASLWDYNWPTGSGQTSSGNAVSPLVDATPNNNLLTNSDFETWSDDVAPELANWVLDVGAWGTDAKQSSTAYSGTYSVEFVAGATNTVLYQEFGTSDGTAASLSAVSSYAVNFYLRKVSGTISAGVLTVELVDDTGTVVNDEQGTANSFTVTLSSLATSWSNHNGVFRVPGEPPSVLRLQYRISTDLAGANFLLDYAASAAPIAAYPGGYGWRVFSGATPFVTGDGWDVTAANNRAGQSYGATFQTLFDRFFDMKQLGLLLPYSGSPSQPDTKITT